MCLCRGSSTWREQQGIAEASCLLFSVVNLCSLAYAHLSKDINEINQFLSDSHMADKITNRCTIHHPIKSEQNSGPMLFEQSFFFLIMLINPVCPWYNWVSIFVFFFFLFTIIKNTLKFMVKKTVNQMNHKHYERKDLQMGMVNNMQIIIDLSADLDSDDSLLSWTDNSRMLLHMLSRWGENTAAPFGHQATETTATLLFSEKELWLISNSPEQSQELKISHWQQGGYWCDIKGNF